MKILGTAVLNSFAMPAMTWLLFRNKGSVQQTIKKSSLFVVEKKDAW